MNYSAVFHGVFRSNPACARAGIEIKAEIEWNRFVETVSAGGKHKKLLDQMRDAMRLKHRLSPFLVVTQRFVTATIRRYGSDPDGSVSSCDDAVRLITAEKHAYFAVGMIFITALDQTYGSHHEALTTDQT